ncbi:MAG: nitronate monooxygenase family protein [Proteobacteria bacterium]|nr:nitronate monooxygenase family protein [Pseudomonadota bacterium]MDA0982527.1 nitronate monooxygenase family protein [Pseudomonadota bacterium]
MSLPPILQRLRLPVICAPMFIASNPALVIEQCRAGVVGSFPALNARPKEALDQWLTEIEQALAAHPGAAPFAVNQICHKSNDRLEHDIEVCIRHKVPITITSLRAPNDVIPKIHAYGGIVLHDVISVRHAEKALADGVDGLILVCAGAGGHAGTLSPFALIGEVRRFFDGPIILSGAITSGDAILAAQAAGADLAYIGTRFLATPEASVPERYKEEILRASASDIVYTDLFSGVHGNYLKHSVVAAGFDPLNLPKSDPSKMNFGTAGGAEKKVWRDIWSAGQGVGQIDNVAPAAQAVDKLAAEYLAARRRLQVN